MQDKRRELLKALTLGGGAVAATQLPTTWSTPVVDSVMLPVHAQTTTIDDDSADDQGCRPVAIPPLTIACDNLPTPGQTSTFYRVDDTGACPVLSIVGGPSDQSTIEVSVSVNAGQDEFIVIVSGGSAPAYEITVSSPGCSEVVSPAPPPTVPPAEFSFEAQSGAIWTALYDWGEDGGFWTLGPITLTPSA